MARNDRDKVDASARLGGKPQQAAQFVEIDFWFSVGMRILDPIEIIKEVGELPPSRLGLGGLERRQVPEGGDLQSRPPLEILTSR